MVSSRRGCEWVGRVILSQSPHLDSECYVCARILAELKHPPEVVKEIIGDDFIKQSTVHKEALHEGEAMSISLCREKDIGDFERELGKMV